MDRNDRTLAPHNYIEFYEGRALFDDTYCVMTREDFEALARYDASLPSGVSVGKVWRRYDSVAAYEECDPPREGKVMVVSRRALLLDD